MTFVGIETTKFNKHISKEIKNFNTDLEIELKKTKIILDPLKLKLNVKTLGTKFKIKEKKIDIESLKSVISINSIFKDDFLLNNLKISTSSLNLKNLNHSLDL